MYIQVARVILVILISSYGIVDEDERGSFHGIDASIG